MQNYYSNFKVFQYLIFQGQPTAAEQAQITSNWTSRFYMYCPNASAAYAPDSYTAVAAASPAGSCGYALGGDTCTLQCASGYTAVAGTAAMTCMRGAWAGHPLVCGGTCPALAAPLAAATCTRFLQVGLWERTCVALGCLAHSPLLPPPSHSGSRLRPASLCPTHPSARTGRERGPSPRRSTASPCGHSSLT